MTLDVEVPDPPRLTDPQQRGHYEAMDMTDQDPVDDYRHAELAEFLESGAWQDAFESWTTETDVSAEQYELLVERNVFDAFDFYWDPSTDEMGFRSPTLSDEIRGAIEDPDTVENELDTLGRIVTEVLENDYLLRDDESFGFFEGDFTGEERTDDE